MMRELLETPLVRSLAPFLLALCTVLALNLVQPDTKGLDRLDPAEIQVTTPDYPYYLPDRIEVGSTAVPFDRYRDDEIAGNVQLHLGAAYPRERLQGLAILMPAADGESTLFYNGTPRGRGVPHEFGGAGLEREWLLAAPESPFGLIERNRVDIVIEKAGAARVRVEGRPIYVADPSKADDIALAIPQWGEDMRELLWTASIVAAICLLVLVPIRATRTLSIAIMLTLAGTTLVLARGQALGWGTMPLTLAASLWIAAGTIAWRNSSTVGGIGPIALRGAVIVLIAGAAAMLALVHAPAALAPTFFGAVTIANLAPIPLLSVVAPLLAVIALRNMIGDLSDMEARNDRARAIIAEQDEQLHAQLRANAIMEERQRFVRDMHDGVGGQLLSLLARLRAKRIDLDQVESEVESGLNDLRLVVDALDRTGATLEEALAMFEVRARQQLSAAQVELVWEQDGLPQFAASDTRQLLSIYRLMQEAITNVVRHAHASKVTVMVRGPRPGDRGAIYLADNGTGFDPDGIARGRGLNNMETRAKRMQLALDLESEPGTGTRLAITFPEHAKAAG